MAESYNDQLNTWLTFISISRMKSFVELIPAPSIRAGTQTLLAVRNTIVIVLSDGGRVYIHCFYYLTYMEIHVHSTLAMAEVGKKER